jgi:hypothetical protein
MAGKRSGQGPGDNEQSGSRYERRAHPDWEREKPGKRHRRGLEEKLRKYEVRAEGYEFVPALMHTLARYVAKVPEKSQTDLERRMARALDEIPDARPLIERAVETHNEIPSELKRRAFSPRYLDLPLDRPIDDAEARQIVERAALFENRPVATLAAISAATKPGHPESTGCCCPPERPPKDPQTPPTRPPNQYELTFTKLYCVDESDPEWWGSDEPYVVFAAITEEMAEGGTAAVAVHSPVYEDVDDGDTRPDSGDENLRIFGFTGPRAIASSVLVTGSCFEHDLGDVSDTTDAVRTALTAVATKAAAAGGVAGWVVAGVAVVGIGVSYLVDLIGADDSINSSIALTITEADADAKTNAVNPFFYPPLHFDGGDGDGIYDAYLKLRRV